MGDRVTFTGRNASEVRDWYHEKTGAPPAESWLITKGQTSATGGQAWRYARGDAEWPETVRAAIYAPDGPGWLPLPDGAALIVDKEGDVWLCVGTPTEFTRLTGAEP